jgi:hypothetical protein
MWRLGAEGRFATPRRTEAVFSTPQPNSGLDLWLVPSIWRLLGAPADPN